MGKGDKRTKRGKRIAGSYGKYRPRTKKNPLYELSENDLLVKSKREKTTKKTAKKAPKAKPVAEVEVKKETKVSEKAATKTTAKTAEKTVSKAEKKKETKVESKPAAKKTAKKSGKDDLKKIEGIGPKTSDLLVAAGIDTFGTLSKTDVDKIKGILAEAGSRYKMIVPDTWPEQAALAAEDKWDELKSLQDKLSGGKRK